MKLSSDMGLAEATTVLKFELTQDAEDPNTVCPDGSLCAGDQSCCPIGGGRYGCCPYPNAVCCSDMRHCCPAGKICNVQAGTCIGESRLEDIIPWASKEKSFKISK